MREVCGLINTVSSTRAFVSSTFPDHTLIENHTAHPDVQLSVATKCLVSDENLGLKESMNIPSLRLFFPSEGRLLLNLFTTLQCKAVHHNISEEMSWPL